jgi:hypothetical protein
MEAICSSELSVETQRTTGHHIPEDNTLHNQRCENPKSYTNKLVANTISAVRFLHFLSVVMAMANTGGDFLHYSDPLLFMVSHFAV